MIDTSFAVLFLTRSSQQTIKNTLLEGQLRSGRGLPKDLSDVRLEKGQIVGQQAIQDVEGMFELLGDEEEDADLDPSVLADKLVLDPDPTKRGQQLERLRRLVDHKNYQIRLKAVKSLGSVRDLHNVSTLIHGLSDPDPRVAKAALDALRFTSRKFVTPDLPPEANPAQLRAVQDFGRIGINRSTPMLPSSSDRDAAADPDGAERIPCCSSWVRSIPVAASGRSSNCSAGSTERFSSRCSTRSIARGLARRSSAGRARPLVLGPVRISAVQLSRQDLAPAVSRSGGGAPPRTRPRVVRP